jgi:hypothetical protein
MEELDALDILRIVSVPGEPNFFALPTQDRPGRIVSQQRRALTIANAIVRAWHGEGRQRLAVIGAGFGGIAAAIYAANEGIRVSLFEQEADILRRFRCSDRYVDPRIADWPRSEWKERRAGLRGLDWEGQEVRRLAEFALERLNRTKALFDLQVYTNAHVIPLPHDGLARPRELWWKTAENPSGQFASFDRVLICTGFGPERMPAGWKSDLENYWCPPVSRRCAGHIVIVGNGDGGICEMIELLGLDARLQREWLSQLDKDFALDELAAQLCDFESNLRFLQDTSSLEASRDITGKYFREVRERFAKMKPESRKSLERECKADLKQITIVGKTKHIFGLHSFAVNRLTAAIFLEPIEDDPLSGHYVARLAPTREPTAKINYFQASARVSDMKWSLTDGATDVELELRMEQSSAPTLKIRCDALIPRGGPDRIEDTWTQMITGTFGPRQSLSQLNLLERAVPLHLLHPNGSNKKNGTLLPVSYAFASEFYDSFTQRSLWYALDSQREMFTNLYLGKLRLDICLWRKLRLSDSNIFDGIFFHELIANEEGALELSSRLNDGSIEVAARGSSYDEILSRWLTKECFPELSLLAPHVSQGQASHPPFEVWKEAKSTPADNGPKVWSAILRRLETNWTPAKWIRQRYEKMAELFGDKGFRRWGRNAARRPAFDALGIKIEDAIGCDPPYITQIKELMREALRPGSTRSAVFQEIQKRFPDYDLVHDQREIRRDSLDDFVTWFNSSYNYGIFLQNLVRYGEFIWAPPDSSPAEYNHNQIEICLICLGKQSRTEFAERLKELYPSGLIGSDLGRTMSVIGTWFQTCKCEHAAKDRKTASRFLPWLFRMSVVRFGDRVTFITPDRKCLSQVEPLPIDIVAES